MQINIRWADHCRNNPIVKPFTDFIQRQANRLCVGAIRYGDPDKDKNYMTRLIMEVKAYRKSGNVEHLYNAANYCILESFKPEHPKFHFDNTVDSATRRFL